MIAAFLAVLLLPTTFVSLEEPACPTDFFGEKCMYQCGCNSSCTATGECPSKICQEALFGPMCQFVDGTYLFTVLPTESFLRDAQESTCNPNSTATSVTLFLGRAMSFLWFRIYASKKDELLNFDVKLNDMVDCLNMKKYLQEDFVDVSCDNTIIGVNELRVNGSIAPSVCSIYISFGRNTALKQATYQRTNFEPGNQSLSQNAVDGIRDGNYSSGHCAQTNVEDHPEWTLIYNRPQVVHLVIVFNRFDKKEQLYGFSYEGLSEMNSTTFSMRRNFETPRIVYLQLVFSPIPTRRLRIKGPLKTDRSNGILALCEVETYSETVCPSGTFGLWCQNTCACQKNEICNSLTGACAPGCSKGFYGIAGFGCSMPCDDCPDNTCDQRTGACDKCHPGFKGQDCSIACDRGLYGQDCAFQCGQGCTQACDSVKGNCSCKSKFVPPNCAACDPGLYGRDCAFTCSKHCRDTCSYLDGSCSCDGNFSPPDCQGCVAKYYGPHCDQPCPAKCLNGACAQSTGHCLSCVDGFSGLSCYNKEGDGGGLPANTDTMWMYALVFMGVGLAIASFGYLVCMKRTTGEDEAQSPI